MKRYIWLAMSLSLASGAATAQSVLTLEECRDRAAQYNKSLSAVNLGVEQAQYTEKSYKSNYLPKVSLIASDLYSTGSNDVTISGGHLPIYNLDAASGSYVPSVTVGPDGSYVMNQYADFPDQTMKLKIKNFFAGGVMLEEPLYTGGKVTAAHEMSKIGTRAAGNSVTLTRSQVIVETDEAYVNAVRAKELIGVAKSYSGVLEELYKNVESAVRHGMKTNNDKLKVQVKLNEAELNTQKAENAYRLARMNLCHVIGKPLSECETFDVESLETSGVPSASTIGGAQAADSAQSLISRRPEYALLQDKVDLAKQEVKLTRSDYLPSVLLTGGYTYSNGMELAGKKLIDGGAASVMLSVKVPILNFGEGVNKVRSSKAKYKAAVLEQADSQEKMTLELTQSANNLQEAETELAMTAKSLEQAEENMRMSRHQYESGMETLTDYLEAQTIWRKAYADNVEAKCQLRLCHTKYLKAAGAL